MKNFTVKKSFVIDGGYDVLTIYIEHKLNKDQWKNRFLLFDSETATYKNERKKELWQNKQNKSF